VVQTHQVEVIEGDGSNRTLCAVGDQRIERGPLEELYNQPFRTLCTVEDQRIERGPGLLAS